MVSFNAAPSAAILDIIRQANSDLTQAQNRISSGLKVASAKDDPTAWLQAKTVGSEIVRNKALLSVMSSYKGVTDAASAGLDTVAGALDDITKLAATMSAAGSATDAQKAQLTGLQNKINAAILGSGFGATNLLTSASAVTANIGYKQDGSFIQATYTANVITSDSDMTAVLAASPDLSSATNIATYATKVANAVSKIAVASANVANFAGSIDTASSFLSKLNDIRDTYVGSLVNADMEKESARVQALQVRLQLSYQALAISGQSASNILRLFQ